MKCKKAATVVAGLLLAMGSAAPAMADAEAEGVAANSPGVLSGNVVQVPVNIPVNVCGNTVNLLAALNPTAGNHCINK
ncbi:chaplin [Streptomyces scopuliridis]|uniref:chaplin n=1 Tax=Streptomyces scopuliridis TaxID=452529 RepID=UPI0036852973